MTVIKRIVITPKEVAALTGRSVSYCRRLVSAIKRKAGKTRTDLITVEEFCAYMHLSVEEVRRAMEGEK